MSNLSDDTLRKVSQLSSPSLSKDEEADILDSRADTGTSELLRACRAV
jgi:hypothetical protein